MQELHTSEADRPRVIAVGSSRVFEGFAAMAARESLAGAEVQKLAHPRFDPFVIRSLVDEIIGLHPSVVVFLWSEGDTHRPLRLEPVPGSSGASVGAVVDLLGLTDLRFAVENRVTLYRLLASSLLDGYRYRRALASAGLDSGVSFRFDERLGRRTRHPTIFGRPLLWDGEPNPVSAAERERILESFGPDANARFVDLSVDFAAEITPGGHSRVQMELMRRSVTRLRGAGVEVLIVECPLHPTAYTIYDRGLRREFLAFAAELERENGVHVVRLEDMPSPFVESDFKDLLHARGPGTAKLTQVIVDAVRPLLPASGSPGD
jgi:hypothetical protein